MHFLSGAVCWASWARCKTVGFVYLLSPRTLQKQLMSYFSSLEVGELPFRYMVLIEVDEEKGRRVFPHV